MDFLKNKPMKKITIIVFFLLIGLTSCSSQQEVRTNLPWKTESVYFQRWIGGQERTGSGINFHLKFIEPFSPNFHLKKVYFRNQEANFIKENETTFIARFYQKPTNSDLILDGNASNEYGNSAPEIIKSTFDLKENEAILEFEQDNKTQFFKINSVKEKELLAYPSTRPRN